MLGARMIEKHFTLNHTLKGTDHAFSLEPTGLRKVVRDLNRCREAAGDGVKSVYPTEKAPIMKIYSLRFPPYALSPMPYALCPMPCALCANLQTSPPSVEIFSLCPARTA